MPLSALPSCLPALVFCGLEAVACAPANSLVGSMSDLTPLNYTQVEVKLQGNALVIEYADFIDGGGNIPFELTLDTQGQALTAGQSFLLDAGTDAGEPVAVASRDVVGDQQTFSAIDRGYLTLSTPVSEGAVGAGNFFVVFTYQTGTLGSGRTVYGNFSAAVTQ